MRSVRKRFWLEFGLCVLSSVLLVLTLVWRDWIELVFGFDPDHGSGALEWIITVVTAAGVVCFAVLARVEWRFTAVTIGAQE